MQTSTVLAQETRMEDGVIIISRTTEERLTKDDLERELETCKRQVQQLVQQSKQIKLQHDIWTNKGKEITTLLGQFGEEDLVVL